MANYPNVPPLPGVPALLRSPQFPAVAAKIATGILVSSAINFFFKKPAKVWGLFDTSGNPVVTFDTFVGMYYKQEYKVADFPIEDGSFTTYSKVETPFGIVARFSQSGTAIQQVAFANAFNNAQASFNLYKIAIPNQSFSSVTIETIDFKRETNNGASMLTFDVTFKQVRVVSAQYVTATKQPAGTQAVSGGKVQPVTPPMQQQSLLLSAYQYASGLFH